MLRLLVTADYELYGDGSGDARMCLLAPTDRLLEVCEGNGVMATLFVDVAELWAFRGLALRDVHETEWTKAANEVETQIQQACGRGHDVQLHLHPQWLGADRKVDGWEVNVDLWRLPSLRDEEGVTLPDLFEAGVHTLEALLRPVDPDYTCRAFRAGGWSIQPEGDTIRAMADAGIRIDTSVAPGCACSHGWGRYRFRTEPGGQWVWRIHDRVDVAAEGGEVVEVPIFTRASSTSSRVLRWLRSRMMEATLRPPGCTGRTEGAMWAWDDRIDHAVEQALAPRRMLDVCVPDLSELKTHVSAARRRLDAGPDMPSAGAPVTAISHPKTLGDPDVLDEFLAWCREQADVRLDAPGDRSFWQTFPAENGGGRVPTPADGSGGDPAPSRREGS